MIMNQNQDNISIGTLGNAGIVIDLKQHDVDIKTEGDNLSITINKKPSPTFKFSDGSMSCVKSCGIVNNREVK